MAKTIRSTGLYFAVAIVLTAAHACADPQPPDATASTLVFSDDFSGALDQWSTDHVTVEHTDGRLYFAIPPEEVITSKQLVPLEDVVVEFDGYAEDNGIQVMLLESREDFYSAAIGMAGNRVSFLMDGRGRQPLAIADGPVYQARQWHHYTMRRHGDRLEAHCDGRQIISATTDRRFTGTGMLAFSSDRSPVGIDNVRVYAMQGGARIDEGPQIVEADAADAPADEPGPAEPQPAEPPKQPRPLDPDSVISRAVICTGLDENRQPADVRSTYPPETGKIGLYLEIKGAAKNTEIGVHWYHDGKLVRRQLLDVSGDARTIVYIYPARERYLRAGRYAAELMQGDTLVARLIVTIGE